MIASSKAKPEAAKEVLKVLREFATNISLEKYKELKKIAIKNIYLWIEKDTKSPTLSEEQLNSLESFKSLITEYHEKIIKNKEEITEEKLKRMKNCAEELFDEIKKLKDSESKIRDFM